MKSKLIRYEISLDKRMSLSTYGCIADKEENKFHA